LTELATMYDIAVATIWARLKRNWDIKKAVSTPVRQKCHGQY
jgi:hypothetical protein